MAGCVEHERLPDKQVLLHSGTRTLITAVLRQQRGGGHTDHRSDCGATRATKQESLLFHETSARPQLSLLVQSIWKGGLKAQGDLG